VNDDLQRLALRLNLQDDKSLLVKKQPDFLMGVIELVVEHLLLLPLRLVPLDLAARFEPPSSKTSSSARLHVEGGAPKA